MSKHVGFYYRCDKCGEEARPHMWCDVAYLPIGWRKIKKMHFCPKCQMYASALLEKEEMEICD